MTYEINTLKTIYSAEQIDHLAYLVQDSSDTFPLTQEAKDDLRVARQTDSFLAAEYTMNFVRFSIGAVCGIIAVYTIMRKIETLNPSLINAMGASVSGALGLLVTLTRYKNLSAASKTRTNVIAALFENHTKAAYVLLQMHQEPSYQAQARDISRQLQTKITKATSLDSLLGLKQKDIVKIVLPLEQAIHAIQNQKRPSFPILDLAYIGKAREMMSFVLQASFSAPFDESTV